MVQTSKKNQSLFSRVAGRAAVSVCRRAVRDRAGNAFGVGGYLESLEPRQMMAADLAVELGNYTPLAFYVPGETVTIPFIVRNNEPSAFTGRAVVSLLLSDMGLLSASSPLVLTNLAADATASGVLSFMVPNGYLPGSFILTLSLALRNAENTANVADNSPIDNLLVLTSNPLNVSWGFGNFGGRTGVVMRAADSDGTQYTMSMIGGGAGYFPFARTGSFDSLTLVGVRGASGPIAQTVNFGLVAGSPGTVEGADFGFRVDATGPELLIGAMNAPAMNFNRGFMLGNNGTSVTNASSTISVRDIGSAASLGDSTFIDGDVGAFTAGAVRGTLIIAGSAGAVRLDSLSGYSGGARGVLQINGRAASLTIGSPANLAATALQNARIVISGDVGAVTIGKMDGRGTNASLTLSGRVGTVTIGDVLSGNISSRRAPISFTVRDVRNSEIYMGQVGNLGTVATPFSAREINRSTVTLLYPVSTFSASKWFNINDSRFQSEGGNVLRANSIATMTVGVAGASADADNGNFDATAYIGGQLSRPTQLGTVNIHGTLSGSFFVAGSVGAFTAKVVQSDLFRISAAGALRDDVPSLDWAPALAATGSVLSFTSGDVRSGAVWVNSVRTLNVTVASSNRNFEVVAGFRADRNAITNGAGRNAVLYGSTAYSAAQIRSGIIGALNLTLRAPSGGAVTGFTGRFAAGLDVLRTDIRLRRFSGLGIGVLNFGTSSDNAVGTPASDGKINAISIVGVIAGNSLGFGARDFPAARFNFGTLQTGAAGVLIPARTNPYSTAISGTSIPANTFFRVGLRD